LDSPGASPDGAFKVAWQLALDCLGRRERSAKELEVFLVKKGIGQAEIAAVLQRLVELRYLDEERLAAALIRDTRMAGRGPRAAWLKLKKRGVAGWGLERVETVWRESSGSALGPVEQVQASELDLALAFIRRRYAGYASDRKQASRALGALVRRGFSVSVARKAIGVSENPLDEETGD